MHRLNGKPSMGVGGLALVGVLLLVFPGEAQARNNIREAFFDTYPNAVGTPIETVPSFPNHCGVCHFAFGGGGLALGTGQTLGFLLCLLVFFLAAFLEREVISSHS